MAEVPVLLDGRTRCRWCAGHAIYERYHDEEWGLPVRDDRLLFEMLNLEGAQAGLSWLTILRKREAYRKAFDGFDPATIAGYDEDKVAALLADPGIVRNRLKVRAVITNAQACLRVVAEEGAFHPYLWSFTGGRTIVNHWTSLSQVPARTVESDAMSRSLAKRGFKFVGSTICYAFMQAVGMVDDHTADCWRRQA